MKMAAAANKRSKETTTGTTIEAVELPDLVDAMPISQDSPWKSFVQTQVSLPVSSSEQ